MEAVSTWFRGLTRIERKELLALLHDVRRTISAGEQDLHFLDLLAHLEDEHEFVSRIPPRSGWHEVVDWDEPVYLRPPKVPVIR